MTQSLVFEYQTIIVYSFPFHSTQLRISQNDESFCDFADIYFPRCYFLRSNVHCFLDIFQLCSTRAPNLPYCFSDRDFDLSLSDCCHNVCRVRLSLFILFRVWPCNGQFSCGFHWLFSRTSGQLLGLYQEA